MWKLREERERLMQATRAPNTSKAYAKCWNHFQKWCVHAGRCALPATPETVSLYATHAIAVEKRRLATVELRLVAVSQKHRAAGLAPLRSKVRRANCSQNA